MRFPRFILCFTRPWELLLHQQLARGLRRSTGTPETSIRYITMWGAAADWLKEHQEPGEEVIYLPSLMKAVSLDAAEVVRLEQLARDLEDWSGTPLATMVACERFLPTDTSSRKEFALRHLHVLERLIPEESILVSGNIDHLCYWIASDLVRWRGGHFFGFGASGRPSGRTQVVTDFHRLWLPYEGEPEHHEEARRQVEEIQSGTLPDYMNIKPPDLTWSQRFRWRRSMIRERAEGNYFVTLYLMYGVSRLRGPGGALRWRRALSIMDPVSLESLKRPFIYLPLHMEPEASTWVWSAHLRDQGFLIDTLARSLPTGVDLVVKENPKMHGRRPPAFYERSRQHPSVVWVHPSTSSCELAKQSRAVISLTGTACLEAVLMGRPAALVGTPPYASAFTDIPQVGDLESLPGLIRDLLSDEGKPDPERVLEQHARYIANMIPSPYLARHREEGFDWPIIPVSDAFESFIVDALKRIHLADAADPVKSAVMTR